MDHDSKATVDHNDTNTTGSYYNLNPAILPDEPPITLEVPVNNSLDTNEIFEGTPTVEHTPKHQDNYTHSDVEDNKNDYLVEPKQKEDQDVIDTTAKEDSVDVEGLFALHKRGTSGSVELKNLNYKIPTNNEKEVVVENKDENTLLESDKVHTKPIEHPQEQHGESEFSYDTLI
ncbi:MAG: hypothetical protein MHPSP_001184 [Paramarteilia canceri]